MYSNKLGMAVVPVADLSDVTKDVNLAYPNGIGKKKGLVIYVDNGTSYDKYMASGAATTDEWVPFTAQEEADFVITWTANEPTAGDTQTIADGTVPTVAELGQAVANLTAKINSLMGAVTPA